MKPGVSRSPLLLLLGSLLGASIVPPTVSQEGGRLEADVSAILGTPAGPKRGEAAAAIEAAAVAAKLRCPVCQGVSIADSPSGMATKMREQVRDLVESGYSEEQVLSYFEHSYGEFVRLEPPMRGLNWMLWAMPGVVLFAGTVFVYARARRPIGSSSSQAASASALDRVPPATGSDASSASTGVDPELAKYLERIRRDSGTSS